MTLKKEGTMARDTVVQLESYHSNDYNLPKSNVQDIKKFDLEIAVLTQVRELHNFNIFNFEIPTFPIYQVICL